VGKFKGFGERGPNPGFTSKGSGPYMLHARAEQNGATTILQSGPGGLVEPYPALFSNHLCRSGPLLTFRGVGPAWAGIGPDRLQGNRELY